MIQSDDAMLQLYLAYKEKLQDKLTALMVQWEALRTAWSKEKLIEFYKTVHKFHGSSGTYGYTDIATHLGHLEDKLSELKNTETITEIDKCMIQDLLDEVKGRIENVLKSEG